MYECSSRTFLLTLVLLMAMPFLVNDAYAGPSINTFVADDPDDADNVYSNGDTLTITLSSAGNVTTGISVPQGDILANFTFSPTINDATFTGEWTDTSTLLITLTSIGGNTLEVGTSTVDVNGATNDIGDPNPNDGTGMIAGSQVLTGDFGVVIALDTDGGGSGCNGDCNQPTLGIEKNGKRLVENGFTYNGKSVNVEKFFTPYPLITVNVGTLNLAEFKIFDNFGPDNISHFELAFGLASGQILSQSKAVIEWDRTFGGTESVTVIDPDNLLSNNVQVVTSEGKCREDSLTDDCLIVKVFHTFRAPPEFNIVGTNVWDSYRNSWQNYYNHGIEVVGKSMNQPKQYQTMDRGNLVTITEVEKNHAVDNDGNHWFFENGWVKEYVPKGKIVDPISKYHGIDRNHAYFGTYLEGQQLVASHTLEQILGEKPISDESPEPFSYEYKRLSRNDDVNLQNTIKSEMSRAQQLYEIMYLKNQYLD